MRWTRIKAGLYRSVIPKTYTITRDGMGLFKDGWRPCWKLRWKNGESEERSTLRAAKAKAEKIKKMRRMGRNRILSRYMRRISDRYNEYLTAYHEAGHMLVNWLTSKRRIFSATCVPGDGYSGLVRLYTPRQEAVHSEMAKGMIMTGLAGDVAVSLVTNEAFDLQSLNETDKRELLKYGPALCGDEDLGAFARRLAEETLELLRDNWEPLSSLAGTLRRMGDLNGRQIDRLLGRLNLAIPASKAA